MRTVELGEYGENGVERSAISDEAGIAALLRLKAYLSVEYPTPINGWRWMFKAGGHIGWFPVTRAVAVHVKPKVPVARVFRMLSHAAHGDDLFEPFDGMIRCDALPDLFDRLAEMLARGVLDRARRGFYRAYVPAEEPLAAVRGRILTREIRIPLIDPRLPCLFDEQTANAPENRILAWTLHRIGGFPALRQETKRFAKRAFASLPGDVSLEPCSPNDCLGRTYNRLNADYRRLHALCWFFLAHTGPSHEAGEHDMVPFAIDMPRLFEAFVAGWLKSHLPSDMRLGSQEAHTVSYVHDLYFRPDLVIRDATRKPRLVLDTKYKTGTKVGTSDLQQIIAYAHQLGCANAALIYPRPLDDPLDVTMNGIRIRTLWFDLGDEDLDRTGHGLIQATQLEGCSDAESH